MFVTKILNDRFGSILVSVILGLGLAAVFRRVCHGDGCVVVRAPDAKELAENVYKTDSSCYRYTPNLVPCPMKQKGQPQQQQQQNGE
jgi:hypothetical protein